ncbi:MAG: carboxypeptidase-like regulatory domain-containing protein [Gemmatimonas sp.]
MTDCLWDMLRDSLARTAGGRAAIAALFTLASTVGHAQEIRGSVVLSDNTPASGIVVLMMHATRDSVLARAVAGENGFFTIRAPAPSTVRLRLLRIGYQPTFDGPHTLAAGSVKNVRIALGDKRVVLATMDVRSDNRCNVRPDSAQLVTKLFEEARKALIASATPMGNAKHVATFTMYQRSQDERGKLVAPVQRSTFSGPSYRPFASLSADSLAQIGYVTETGDDVIYRAPDADVLLSDSFLGAHCLQFVQGTGDRAASVGIGFRPADRKTGMIDIKGTLWLDRQTNELQTLEYSYEGVPQDYEKLNVGGQVEYTQLSAGLWFVNRWAIRMPRMVSTVNVINGRMRGSMDRTLKVEGLVITGGEVVSVKADDDFLYSNPTAVTAGREPRDLRDYASNGGEFSVAEGVTAVQVREITGVGATDSLFAMSSCSETAPNYSGRVLGKVRALNGQRVDSIVVFAEWKDEFKVGGRNNVTWEHRRLETRTKPDGSYTVCGLPVNRLVTVAAISDGRTSRVATAKANVDGWRATLDLSIGNLVGTVASASDKNGRGTLMLVTDVNGNPVPFANVSISGAASRVTDNQGALILPVAQRDSLSVIARRIGYQAFQGKIGRDSANAPYVITLAPNAQVLATRVVREAASSNPLQQSGFYERMRDMQRGAGRGYFFTPEELDAHPATHVHQFIQGRTPVMVGTTGRGEPILMGRSGSRKCALHIVVDGIVQRGTITGAELQAGTSLDIRAIAPFSQAMAIEVYPSELQVPPSIAGRITGLNCGAVVIWNGPR